MMFKEDDVKKLYDKFTNEQILSDSKLKYISNIDKNRVKSWVLKSRLVESVLLPELFSYYDILTESKGVSFS